MKYVYVYILGSLEGLLYIREKKKEKILWISDSDINGM